MCFFFLFLKKNVCLVFNVQSEITVCDWQAIIAAAEPGEPRNVRHFDRLGHCCGPAVNLLYYTVAFRITV